MQVKCISNKEGGFLEEGQIYTVYSTLIDDDSCSYLIAEKDCCISYWFSAEHFEVVSHLVLPTWYFAFKGYGAFDEVSGLRFPTTAIWGYKEMVYDPYHRINLIDREPETLEIFKKRQEEMDEFEELISIESK